jgi:hypothetical protein
MSAFTGRTGQKIGPWTVEADIGRSKRGRVIWRLRADDGRVKHLHTYQVIRLAREHNVPPIPTTEESYR